MIKELNSNNFDASVGSTGMHVVRFWAEWCGPCRVMSPVFKEAAQDLADGVHFGEVNMDHSPELAQRYGVQSIPAVLLFKDNKLVDRAVGARPKAQLLQFIKQHLD